MYMDPSMNKRVFSWAPPNKWKSIITRSDLIHKNVCQTPIWINIEYLISDFPTLTFLTDVKLLPYRYEYQIVQLCWCFFFWSNKNVMESVSTNYWNLLLVYKKTVAYQDSIHEKLTFSCILFSLEIHQWVIFYETLVLVAK